MKSNSHDFISLGADVGGRGAHNATNAHILALRQLLQVRCKGDYGTSVKEVALVLRIDGDVQSWQKSGADNFGFQKRTRLATADIYVPISEWYGHDGGYIRKFLAVEVKNAISSISNMLEQRGIKFDAANLKNDVAIAINEYLQ